MAVFFEFQKSFLNIFQGFLSFFLSFFLHVLPFFSFFFLYPRKWHVCLKCSSGISVFPFTTLHLYIYIYIYVCVCVCVCVCVSVSRHTECRATASVTLPSDLHITLVSALSYCLLQNLMASPPLPGRRRCSARVFPFSVNRLNLSGKPYACHVQ